MFWNIAFQSMIKISNLIVEFGGVVDPTNITLEKTVHYCKATECKVHILAWGVDEKLQVGATMTIGEKIKKRRMEDPYGVMAKTTLQDRTKSSDN